MSELKPGQVGWIDISVGDANTLKDFYGRVVGWTSEAVDMDGYQDHCMIPAGTETPVAGICHARGSNAELPPQRLIYITVEDLDQSLKSVEALGTGHWAASSPLRIQFSHSANAEI